MIVAPQLPSSTAIDTAEQRARELIRLEERAYERLIKAPTDAGGDGGPGEFCAGLMQRLGAELDVGSAAVWDRLIRAAGAPRLTYVLAAFAAQRQADWERCYDYAKTAVAMDHRDTFAQRLYLTAADAMGSLRSAGLRDDDLREWFCPFPFEELAFQGDGRIHTCCPSWLPVPIGTMADAEHGAEVWNSAAAQEVRRSVLDGDFRHCSRLNCPVLLNRRLVRRRDVRDSYHREIIDRHLTRLERGPKRVSLSYDKSCNLSCRSCRSKRIMARRSTRERYDRFAEQVVLPLLRDAEIVHINGAGDPFASGHCRRLLTRLAVDEFRHVRLDLQTNGVLLDREAWRELQLRGRVDRLWVSIDAATPATYAAIRRGGDWTRLLRNLVFMRELRRNREIRTFRLDFVVQARNFRELPAVVELARVLGCDRVRLQMIRNWGTFSPAEFKQHFIGAPDHPAFEEFLEVLRHPNLADPIIDPSTVRPMLDQARARAGASWPSSTAPIRGPSAAASGRLQSRASHAAATSP